jgi:hypothetical protein
MIRQIPAATALLWLGVSATAFAQDAKTVIDNALRAIGAANMTSIVISGEGAYGNWGQSRTISFGLASTSIRQYTRVFDFSKPASRETGTAVPPKAGGGPSGPFPWDDSIGPDAPWVDQVQIWVTPWGFLKGAAANAATVRSRKIEGVQYNVVTWSPATKAPSGQPYRLIGYLNEQQILERVETWIEHPVLGDMHVEAFFRDWANFGSGVLSPTRMTQRQTGMETYVTVIREARANPSDLERLLTPSANALRREIPASQPAVSEKLAEGVYRIRGGYESLAVEFSDHVVVVEGGESEARGLAVSAEVK